MSLFKKTACLILALIMCLGALAGCGASSTDETSSGSADDVSREEGLQAVDYSDYITLGTYTGLDVTVDEVSVTDEMVQEQINSILSQYTTTEQITDRVTRDEDTINLDYSGLLNGEAFTGGTATGQTYTIGGNFIESLDRQLIGLNVGEEYNLDVTFPDDYSSADLAGKDVVFVVTVNYIQGEEIVPEWNDDFVNEVSSGQMPTTAAAEQNIRETLEQEALDSQKSQYLDSLWEAIISNCELSELPTAEVEEAANYYYTSNVSYYTSIAEANSMTYDDFMSAMGISDEDMVNYCNSMAEAEVESFVVANMIFAAEGMSISVDDYVSQATAEASDYSYASLEDFEAEAGVRYLTNCYKYQMVLDWLAENNNMIIGTTETAAE